MPDPGATGFYGKLPAQGDFVVRRLASGFVQQWDAWLQACLAHSRNALGAAWEQLYRNAPVWRFLLAPGTCGNSAWAGLMQPSIDRVGRYFPLTVVVELPSDLEVLDTMALAEHWYDAVEGVTELAFGTEVSLEELDARLAATVFPAAAIVPSDSAEDTLPLNVREAPALKIGCPPGQGIAYVRSVLREEQVDVGHSHCVWFDATAETIERVVLVSRALPEPDRFCALLDGAWERHGWATARCNSRLSA